MNLRTILILLFITPILYSQTLKDTVRNEKKTIADERKERERKSEPLSIFNPKLKSESFMFPLNLKIYSKVFSNDYKEPVKFSREELSSGMSDEELMGFRKNRLQLEKELKDFYGEDLIDMEKLLKSLGITKEQVIMFAAMLKFIFAQSLLPVPR